jgi:hypothetical protein
LAVRKRLPLQRFKLFSASPAPVAGYRNSSREVTPLYRVLWARWLVPHWLDTPSTTFLAFAPALEVFTTSLGAAKFPRRFTLS